MDLVRRQDLQRGLVLRRVGPGSPEIPVGVHRDPGGTFALLEVRSTGAALQQQAQIDALHVLAGRALGNGNAGAAQLFVLHYRAGAGIIGADKLVGGDCDAVIDVWIVVLARGNVRRDGEAPLDGAGDVFPLGIRQLGFALPLEAHGGILLDGELARNAVDKYFCRLARGGRVAVERHAGKDIRGLDLHGVGPEGLLGVEVVLPLRIQDDGLDPEVLAGHLCGDVTGVVVGGIDVVVPGAQIAGTQAQAVLVHGLSRVHVELSGSPGLVQRLAVFVARQAVVGIGDGVGILRVHRVHIGVDVVVLNDPFVGIVELPLGLGGAGEDVVGAGDHLEGVAVLVGLPPLVVDVKDLVVVLVVGHAGLAVEQVDPGIHASLRLIAPLQGGKVVLGLHVRGVLGSEVRQTQAAEDDGGLAGGRGKLASELHPVVRFVVAAEDQVLLHAEGHAVELAGLEALPALAFGDALGDLPVLDLLLHVQKRQLALEGVVAGAVAHGDQGGILPVDVGFDDVVPGQGVYPIDLVGEVALGGLQIVALIEQEGRVLDVIDHGRPCIAAGPDPFGSSMCIIDLYIALVLTGHLFYLGIVVGVLP